VQLGRLGYAEAVERSLLESDAFAPADHGQVDGDCVFFPATEQAACGAFLNYWQEHGLDFGDDGVSFRESLALFGYPISQEFVDPESGLVTQYFERARFEYHPENPEDYRVLLGLLGAEIVDQRDW
jgi:spore germination protein